MKRNNTASPHIMYGKNVIKINHTKIYLACCFGVLKLLPNNLKNDYVITMIKDILDDAFPINAFQLML
tara:strand:- start:9442 stop:9645 length:204 start_codon:yes stop_codon:yes gene_type:complete